MTRSRGLGSVCLRGNVWWIKYHHRGKAYRESSGSYRKSGALDLLRARLNELESGIVGAEARKVTFEDLAQLLLSDYQMNHRKSLARARGALKRLRETFGGLLAVDITGSMVRKYVTNRLESVAPATVQKELAALKRAFNLAQREGKVVLKPYIPSIRVDNARRGFFEPDELASLLEATREHDRASFRRRRSPRHEHLRAAGLRGAS